MLQIEKHSKILTILKTRFEQNMYRHPNMNWEEIQAKLEIKNENIEILQKMEDTGGEPDVINYDGTTGSYIFCDCSKESPSGRRSLCFDANARLSRKEHAPKSSVEEIAEMIGIQLLDESEYRHLQSLGPIDTKTSSWIKTPQEMRNLEGALFGDYRYGQVFFYHNGAESYYASRGFRGSLHI